MKLNMKKTVLGLTMAAVIALPSFAMAGNIHLAVASNFKDCITDLIEEYEATHEGKTVTFVSNSSGNLITEIRDTPSKYQVFFSADAVRPTTLKDEKRAEGVVQYASGRLVAYSTSLNTAALETAVTTGVFTNMAIANPALAPYGKAAEEMIAKYNYPSTAVIDATSENIQGPLDKANSGAFQIGMVSKGQVVLGPASMYWEVPTDKYNAINQDACIIYQNFENGQGTNPNAEAIEFLNWVMTSDEADDIIQNTYGYGR